MWYVFFNVSSIKVVQTLANNSTPPHYSKNIRYSAIIRGRIVGRIVAQYSTRGRVENLHFRRMNEWMNESFILFSQKRHNGAV